jgi:hypothetical protein
MDQSERLQRYKTECTRYDTQEWAEENDSSLANRIAAFLNHPQIDESCMVDAYYYDFSVIPREIQERLQLWRDSYLIFGITTEGEMITKWVDRWDFDSSDPIVDGKLFHPNTPFNNLIMKKIREYYDPILLSTPMPDCTKRLYEETV